MPVTQNPVAIIWNGKQYASSKPISVVYNWGLNRFQKLPGPVQGLLVRALNDGASNNAIRLSLIAEFPKDKSMHYGAPTVNAIVAGLKAVGIIDSTHRNTGKVVTSRVENKDNVPFKSILSVK